MNNSYAISNLRHLYNVLVNGGVRTVESAQAIAHGLLSRVIVELEQKQFNLKPITACVVVDDGGENPRYCVMAAYSNKEDAVEALERIS